MTDDLAEGETLFRFHEGPGVWDLSAMAGEAGYSATGVAGSYPEWLARIVSVGKAGAHDSKPISPPPRSILWFVTDQDFNLLRFTPIGGAL